MEFIVWLLGELLFNALVNLLFFLGHDPGKEPTAVQRMGDVLGALVVGGGLGLLSVCWWGQPLLAWPAMRWANLVLSPLLVTGLVVVWRARRARATGHGLLRVGVMSFCLTFGLVITRYFSFS